MSLVYYFHKINKQIILHEQRRLLHCYFRIIIICLVACLRLGGRRGRDRMVVEFTTTYVISAYQPKVVISNPAHGEVYSIQHYLIQFIGCFHRVLLFPVPVKLTATI